jgi:hypothetical protein
VSGVNKLFKLLSQRIFLRFRSAEPMETTSLLGLITRILESIQSGLLIIWVDKRRLWSPAVILAGVCPRALAWRQLSRRHCGLSVHLAKWRHYYKSIKHIINDWRHNTFGH